MSHSLLIIITPLVESSANMMYQAAHAGVPEDQNVTDNSFPWNLRGGAHGNDPSRHPTQDLHGVVRADCCAPVVEDVGWGDILHSPVDLHGYVDGAMLHYYCITLERHVIIALDTIPIPNI